MKIFYSVLLGSIFLLSGCVTTQGGRTVIGNDWSLAWQHQVSESVKRNYFKTAGIDSLCVQYTSAYSGGMRDEGKRKYIRLELIGRGLSPLACDNPEMDNLKRAELKRNKEIRALKRKNNELEDEVDSLRRKSSSERQFKDGHRAGCVINSGIWSNGVCQ